MLILSRKTNESIMIGETIEVTIIDVIGKTIKIGINAPKDVTVHRKEVYEAIKNENIKAVPRENIISLIEIFNKHKK